MRSEAASKYGCIDILVNNAGVSESTPFTEYTEETFDKVMDLNVKGVFNATRAASECMIAKVKVLFSPHPQWSAFTASPVALLIPHPNLLSMA